MNSCEWRGWNRRSGRGRGVPILRVARQASFPVTWHLRCLSKLRPEYRLVSQIGCSCSQNQQSKSIVDTGVMASSCADVICNSPSKGMLRFICLYGSIVRPVVNGNVRMHMKHESHREIRLAVSFGSFGRPSMRYQKQSGVDDVVPTSQPCNSESLKVLEDHFSCWWLSVHGQESRLRWLRHRAGGGGRPASAATCWYRCLLAQP